MKILALDKLVEGVDPQRDIVPLLRNEATIVWQRIVEGSVREIYSRGDRGGAALILEAEDVDAARRLLAEQPLVKAGFVEFDLIPLLPYRQLGMLFASADDAPGGSGDR